MVPEATRGSNTKEAYRSRITAAERSYVKIENPTRHTFVKTLMSHFDALPINWDKYQAPELVHSAIPRIASAFSLAYKTQHDDFPPDSVFTSEASTWSALTAVFDDPKAYTCFEEKLVNLPVSFVPKRAKVVGMVLHHEFDDKPISVVDLGAGAGYMLPLIANPELMQGMRYDDPRANIIAMQGSGANLSLGVNVDILDKREVTERTYANADEKTREQLALILQGASPEQFPYIKADMTDSATCAAMVKKMLREKTGKGYADAVVTSFSLYQIKNRVPLFTQIQQMIGSLLGEKGIWIDVGRELGSQHIFVEHVIDVSTFANNQTIYKGSPFVIDDQGEITDIVESYFK